MQQSDRYLIGGARDLSTAIIGRRAAECELELLLLLDPAGASEQGPRAFRPQSDNGTSPPTRDLPSGLELAELGRRLLLEELIPLLPPERHREGHLVATAIAIAARESMVRETSGQELLGQLAKFYGSGPRASRPPLCGRDGRSPDESLRRFALDLRNGAFETCPSQECAARVILWRIAIARLREANPYFLATHGFA